MVNSKDFFLISGKPRLVNSLVFRSFLAKRISQLGKTGYKQDDSGIGIFENYLGRVDSNSSSFAVEDSLRDLQLRKIHRDQFQFFPEKNRS